MPEVPRASADAEARCAPAPRMPGRRKDAADAAAMRRFITRSTSYTIAWLRHDRHAVIA